MKISIETIVAICVLSLLTSNTVWADDNVAACEIVVQQPVMSSEEKKETDTEATPMIATFIPAEDFVYSVFDSEDGHITEVDGHPIQALMCKRRNLIPTEFDLRLIETHIPFYLSQDFDSADSDLMAVYFKDDKYQYQYSGSDLGEDKQEMLDIRMTALNTKEKE